MHNEATEGQSAAPFHSRLSGHQRTALRYITTKYTPVLGPRRPNCKAVGDNETAFPKKYYPLDLLVMFLLPLNKEAQPARRNVRASGGKAERLASFFWLWH